MQRKEAEKLLAALIFDDLDETSKTELLNYLQTDNELRERLADMRMAVKVASDTVQHGPDPVLGKRRLKRLARLARHQRSWPTFFTVPRLAAAAAIFIVSALFLTGIQTLDKEVPLADVLKRIEPAYAVEQTVEADTPSESPGKQTPEVTSTRRQFAFHPAARSPGAVDSGTVLGLPETVTDLAFQDDSRNFIVDDFGEFHGAETSSPQGYAYLPTRPDSIERRTSASTWESKPHSEIRAGNEYDGMGRFPGGGMGGYGGGGYGGGMMGGYGDGSGYGSGGYGGMGRGNGKTGGYRGSPFGWGGGGLYSSYGGMGGFGGGGYSGVGGSGGGMMVDYGVYGDGKGYSASGWKGGNGRDAVNGSESGDRLFVKGDTYDGDKDFGSKGTNLFDISSDDPAVVADGDSIPGSGRVTFQNGKAVGTKIDGSTIDSFDVVVGKDGAPSPVTVVAGQPVIFTKPDDPGIVSDGGGEAVGGGFFFQNGHAASIKNIELPMDNFTVFTDKVAGQKPVTLVGGQPVTFTKPKSALPTEGSFGLDIELSTSTKPVLVLPSKPKGDVSDISNLPDIKLHTEGTESHIVWEGTKTDTSYEYPSSWGAFDKNDAVFKKLGKELGMKGFQLIPEKAKLPVPAHGKVVVVGGSPKGDVSKEAEEVSAKEESTDELDVISGTDSEKYIADLLGSADEIKTLLKEAESTGRDSLTHLDESSAKRENRGVPILGDMPLVGGLYRNTTKKRPLTDIEKRQIVKYYIEGMKNKPEGESAISALLSQPGFDVKLEALSMTDKESEVDRTSTLTVTGEDGPDLPPASRFKIVPVNPWVMAERDPFSTFALDVDTASYTLCRRYIRGGFLPPAGAVRMEEFINYFNYHYPQRTNPTFKVHAEAAPSPFARKEQNLTLLKIGVKARTIGRDQRKAAHLIFVVDASASMDQPDRLPLVQRALSLLVNKLSAVDRVSLITCANEARLHLETTPARERDRIRKAIGAIQPAGSTNLLAGLKLGYATARRTFAPKQINHVVLCSDGVANVGQTEAEAVLGEVAADRKQGITITCVGVGYGSYNDAFMEALANRGDGSYMFLDSARQAHRVFVRQLAATLQTVAKDARIQVDFNPNRVRRYRLIGYENRDIEDKRFRDDTIDAGEVGSGQCSTALYELELTGQSSADKQGDLGTVFVRYRNVATGQIEEISSRLGSEIVRRRTVESAPRFFLAAGAARFAEILRQSEHAQNGNLMDVLRVVEQVSLTLPLDRDVRELAGLILKAEGLPRSP